MRTLVLSAQSLRLQAVLLRPSAGSSSSVGWIKTVYGKHDGIPHTRQDVPDEHCGKTPNRDDVRRRGHVRRHVLRLIRVIGQEVERTTATELPGFELLPDIDAEQVRYISTDEAKGAST